MFPIMIEKSEYYTLEEASDYLCLKHKITTISAKKLLKKIVSYQTPTYIHARGFYLSGDFITTVPLTNDTSLKENQELTLRVVKTTEQILSTLCEGGDLLLQLHPSVIEKMPLGININTEMDTDESSLFVGALHLSDLSKNSKTLDYLSSHVDRQHGHYVTKVLALYPSIKYLSSEDDNCIEFLNRIKPLYNGSYDTCNNEFSIIYFTITPEDLLILHTDLALLEEALIEGKEPDINQQLNVSDIISKKIKPRQGVSLDKMRTKEAAVILAKALWDEDKAEQIKITDMAFKVYASLHDSAFNSQLPDKAVSLKKWIEKVAPEYARKGGRPRENNRQ